MSRLVSIVLPTYNGEQFLADSIDSCLAQTYRHIELIVVDDCSTDGTSHLLRTYRRDARLKVIRHDVNRKLPAALNTGFEQSKGAYLTWTSDDNLFAPIAIEQMVAHLDQHADVGFVYTDYWLLDEDGYAVRRVRAGPPNHLRDQCSIACFLYRREVYEAVGDYDTRLFRIEDYDYWLRVSQQFKLGWHPEPLYFYRRHTASLTSEDQLEDRARRFDRLQSKYFGRDSGRRSRVLTQYYIAQAFESHYGDDRRSVLRFASRALRRSPALIRNRGVRSIIVQAILGKSLARALKRWPRRPPALAADSQGLHGEGPNAHRH